MIETLPETSKTKKEFTEEETKVIRFIGVYTAAWIIFYPVCYRNAYVAAHAR